MNEEKIKILLRLYKQDLITTSEFLILCKETPCVSHADRNCTQNQPLINPYYTGTTGDLKIITSKLNSVNNNASILSTYQHTTISDSFLKME